MYTYTDFIADIESISRPHPVVRGHRYIAMPDGELVTFRCHRHEDGRNVYLSDVWCTAHRKGHGTAA